MDDDLVKRLRSDGEGERQHEREARVVLGGLLDEAADRIEALTAEVQRLTYDGIHTCHAECPRLPCTLRREIEALTAELLTTGFTRSD